MLIHAKDRDYSAEHRGIKMKFFYKKEFQCQLEVRTAAEARKLLNDWARLKIPPAQLQEYFALIKNYVGATVDDVVVGKDGQYYINGKSLEVI